MLIHLNWSILNCADAVVVVVACPRLSFVQKHKDEQVANGVSATNCVNVNLVVSDATCSAAGKCWAAEVSGTYCQCLTHLNVALGIACSNYDKKLDNHFGANAGTAAFIA